ncbi:MAG: hypothetical protein RSC40_02475 [Clostridia bacterium]
MFPMSCIADVIHPDMLPPLALTDEEEAGIYTSAMMLVVNPYSAQQAEAMAYLEYLARSDCERSEACKATCCSAKHAANQQWTGAQLDRENRCRKSAVEWLHPSGK